MYDETNVMKQKKSAQKNLLMQDKKMWFVGEGMLLYKAITVVQ